MSASENCLMKFAPVSLETLDRVDFSDRMDSKSVFAARLLPEFLERLLPFYFILEQGGKRTFQYESLYFDTARLQLFLDHHRGLGNRQKLRYRRYADSNVSFFEIKMKNNCGRSHKIRIPVASVERALPPAIQEAIRIHTELEPEALQPALSISLNRITLLHREGLEKVTFDSDIRFEINGSSKTMDGVVIAEVKQIKFNPESDFLKVQHRLGVRTSSVSKYCLGISLLNQNVKANRFKAGRLRLEKIMA